LPSEQVIVGFDACFSDVLILSNATSNAPRNSTCHNIYITSAWLSSPRSFLCPFLGRMHNSSIASLNAEMTQ